MTLNVRKKSCQSFNHEDPIILNPPTIVLNWPPQKTGEPKIQGYAAVTDAFIVYPDPAHKSVHSSIRLEAMREGIEDYELLRVLKEKDPAEAERLANQAIRNFTDYVRDVPDFRGMERQLLEALSRSQ